MPMLDLELAAATAIRLLDGMSDEQLGDPTPCPEMSVARLLDHFMGLCLAFTWAAEKSTPESASGPPQSSADHLDPEWRTVLPERLTALVDAWRQPAAWQGFAEAGGVTMPGDVLGAVALDELVMHGWDLARATGQPYECDRATTEAILAFTRGIGPPGERSRAGRRVRPGRRRAGEGRSFRSCSRVRRPRPAVGTPRLTAAGWSTGRLIHPGRLVNRSADQPWSAGQPVG